MKLYENIKRRREELHMTQGDLAGKTGYADKTMISKIEKGVIDLPQSKIQLFADALRTTPRDLMGWADETSGPTASRIPVLGRVAAGIPIDAFGNKKRPWVIPRAFYLKKICMQKFFFSL